MCMECGCDYENGAWKYDMQPMMFTDDMKVTEGPIIVSGLRELNVETE